MSRQIIALYDENNMYQSCITAILEDCVRIPVEKSDELVSLDSLIRTCRDISKTALIFDDCELILKDYQSAEKFMTEAQVGLFVFCQNRKSAERVLAVGNKAHNNMRLKTDTPPEKLPYIHPVDPSTILNNLTFAGLTGGFIAVALTAAVYSEDNKKTEMHIRRWKKFEAACAKYELSPPAILEQIVNHPNGLQRFENIDDLGEFYEEAHASRLFFGRYYRIETDEMNDEDNESGIQMESKKCIISYPFPSEKIATYFGIRLHDVNLIVFEIMREGKPEYKEFEWDIENECLSENNMVDEI